MVEAILLGYLFLIAFVVGAFITAAHEEEKRK